MLSLSRPEGYLTTGEFAKHSGSTYSLVYSAINARKLPYIKVGKFRLIHKDTPFDGKKRIRVSTNTKTTEPAKTESREPATVAKSPSSLREILSAKVNQIFQKN